MPKNTKATAVVDEELRALVLARDNYTCQACGRKTAGQIHHIKARGQGGTHALTNLVTLCGRCHMVISPVPAFTLRRAFGIEEQDMPKEKASVEEAVHRFHLKLLAQQTD